MHSQDKAFDGLQRNKRVFAGFKLNSIVSYSRMQHPTSSDCLKFKGDLIYLEKNFQFGCYFVTETRNMSPQPFSRSK